MTSRANLSYFIQSQQVAKCWVRRCYFHSHISESYFSSSAFRFPLALGFGSLAGTFHTAALRVGNSRHNCKLFEQTRGRRLKDYNIVSQHFERHLIFKQYRKSSELQTIHWRFAASLQQPGGKGIKKVGKWGTEQLSNWLFRSPSRWEHVFLFLYFFLKGINSLTFTYN